MTESCVSTISSDKKFSCTKTGLQAFASDRHSAEGAEYDSQGQARSASALAKASTSQLALKRAQYAGVYFGPPGLKLSLVNLTRGDALRACPWLSYSAPSALTQRMRKIFISFFVCLLLTISVYAQTGAAKKTELKTALQLKLDEWHKAGSFPGATLGVVLANGESFGLAVGFSNRETRTSMKPTDRMLAGSVGKTFAAATALQLVKEGKIGLDDKIEKYVGSEGWFSSLPNAKDITVRQLMNHTSGLVRYEFKEQFTKDLTANPEKVWKPAELVAYLFGEKAPFEAGKGWDYSDTNYIVLGMIIEKVTGRKFYDEANRRLLKPLKLTDTIPQDGPRLKGVVQGYAGPNNPFGGTDTMIVDGKFVINPQFEWTGGGYASTAHDLARWAKMIYEGKAFSSDLLPQVLDGASAPMLGRETKYGLGVIIRKTTVGTSYGHSGFFPGYMTDMMYFPEHKVAIAVQVNTSVGRSLGKPLSRVLVEAMEIIAATKL
jgi:D-alanyl-D-alanine carboxypeptidase